jgi:hypothetical protein
MTTRSQILGLILATTVVGLQAAPKSAVSQASPERLQGDVTYNGPIINLNQPSAPQAWTGVEPVNPVKADDDEDSAARDPHERGLSLGGPRFGFSYADGGGFEKMRDAVKKAKPDVDIEPFMTQFGWQMEYRLFKTSKGLTALTELIPLVGGMDQGLALPSATWLVGLRGKHGFEVGVGPNMSLGGASMMLGCGYTFDMGGINIPVNLAVGRGAYQTTGIAFSTGFNL